jgi:serine protease Do
MSMYDQFRQNAKLLLMVGVALLISFGLAAGIAERRQPRFPPLQTVSAPVITPVSRDVRSAMNLSDAFATISASITPGVVRIEAERIPDQPRRFLPSRYNPLMDDSASMMAPEVAGGSGFIVSTDGYVVTNNHVVEDADLISVRLYDKRTLPARLVGRDPFTDVALLKIEATGLPALHFGDSDVANVGEWVLAIGNPGFGGANTLDFTVTSGIISAKGRPLQALDPATGDQTINRFAIEDFIQTDAAINPGNSGGPLLNLRGEVVGVNTAIASSTGYNQGYAFAIPSRLVQRVIRDLAEFGHVRRPMLGVSIKPVSEEDAHVYKLKEITGVFVEGFNSDDTPARQAGIQLGDVITTVDGKKIEQVGQLQRLIAEHKPGETVLLHVVRYGVEHDFRIKLAQAPLPLIDHEPKHARAVEGEHRIGIQVEEMTTQLARDFGFDDAGGAVIVRVNPFSSAARKGITPQSRILEINQKKIRSRRDAEAQLRNLRSGQVISLVLQDSQGNTNIANVRVP